MNSESEKTDTKNNNIDDTMSKEETSQYHDNEESVVRRDNTVNDQDNEIENIKIEQNVVIRRRIDRKRASVKTKLWRRSMMERSVLPPPPLPPDSPQPSIDNNTVMYEKSTAYPERIPTSAKDNEGSNMPDNADAPGGDEDVTPSVLHHFGISETDTTTSIKSSQNENVSPKDNIMPTHPVLSLDNKQPRAISRENKWMSRKRLSLIKRQGLSPPPVPPNSTQ